MTLLPPLARPATRFCYGRRSADLGERRRCSIGTGQKRNAKCRGRGETGGTRSRIWPEINGSKKEEEEEVQKCRNMISTLCLRVLCQFEVLVRGTGLDGERKKKRSFLDCSSEGRIRDGEGAVPSPCPACSWSLRKPAAHHHHSECSGPAGHRLSARPQLRVSCSR